MSVVWSAVCALSTLAAAVQQGSSETQQPQTRTKVLNNDLEEVFRRWYPVFRVQAQAGVTPGLLLLYFLLIQNCTGTS